MTVRQLLTMTSGVKWNEDYTDVNSDVARMYAQTPDPGFDMTVSYVRKLPREAPPGTKWVYKTVGDESRRRAGGGGDAGSSLPTTCRKRSGAPTAWSATPNG